MNEAERGSQIEFDKVLLLDNEGVVTVGAPVVEGAKVICEVVSHVRGEKVIRFSQKTPQRLSQTQRSPSEFYRVNN